MKRFTAREAHIVAVALMLGLILTFSLSLYTAAMTSELEAENELLRQENEVLSNCATQNIQRSESNAKN